MDALDVQRCIIDSDYEVTETDNATGRVVRTRKAYESLYMVHSCCNRDLPINYAGLYMLISSGRYTFPLFTMPQLDQPGHLQEYLERHMPRGPLVFLLADRHSDRNNPRPKNLFFSGLKEMLLQHDQKRVLGGHWFESWQRVALYFPVLHRLSDAYDFCYNYTRMKCNTEIAYFGLLRCFFGNTTNANLLASSGNYALSVRDRNLADCVAFLFLYFLLLRVPLITWLSRARHLTTFQKHAMKTVLMSHRSSDVECFDHVVGVWVHSAK